MKDKILKILKRVPAKLSYSELIKCAIEDDTSISDLIAIYDQFYELIDDIFEALEEDPEDAKKEDNSDTNEATN